MRTKDFTATENWELGDAGAETVSRFSVQIQDLGSFSGSVTPMGRIRGSSMEFRELAWYNMATAADVAAGSAPTGEALMLIDASGLDVRLDVVRSAGSIRLGVEAMTG